MYLLAQAGADLAGFISLTPPEAPRYFVERPRRPVELPAGT
ncbi:hypothetical protein [Micromonospora sp. IBSANI012]